MLYEEKGLIFPRVREKGLIPPGNMVFPPTYRYTSYHHLRRLFTCGHGGVAQ